MSASAFFSKADPYLAQLLKLHRGENHSLSPSALLSGATPQCRPQLWQMERAHGLVEIPLTLSLSGFERHVAHSPASNLLSVSPNHHDSTDDDFLHSDLQDNEFFRLYAEKHSEKIDKNEPFTLKLYRILHEAAKNGDDHIISFCPSGRSFTIHDTDEFVKKIMPKYFTSNRMTSFQRQLNLYGFRRRLRGEDKGGFFHDSFIKGQRQLCLTIKRRAQNFKVPPHLLSNGHQHHHQTPVAATPRPATACILSPATTRITTSHGNIEPSPCFKQSALTVPASRNMHNIMMDGFPSSLRSSFLRSAGVPTLPCLRMSEDLMQQSSFVSASSTSELLKLNQKIILAKERAAMKQHIALAAIHRLVNRIDL